MESITDENALEKRPENMMELIDFRIFKKNTAGEIEEKIYGINVYKVRDVIFKPDKITRIPSNVEGLEGIINIRDQVIPVINLQHKLGYCSNDLVANYLIITEFNDVNFAFMVHEIKKIMRFYWSEVSLPPQDLKEEYGDLITGITILNEKEIMLILDFEKIIADMYPNEHLLDDILNVPKVEEKVVLCIDDSKIARQMATRTLQSIGLKTIEAQNGVEGLKILEEKQRIADQNNTSIRDYVQMVLCDVEMPIMDGFTFIKEVRKRKEMKKLPILLHSSLSKAVMGERSEKIGADKYLTKFDAKSLVDEVQEFL